MSLAAQGGNSWKTIRINGILYPCSSVRISELGTFIRRITTGPADMDTDDYVSSWIISDLTGGGQVWNGKETTDANRYRHGTVETAYPGQLTLQLLVTETRPSGITNDDFLAYPIGDIGTQMYVCWSDGTDVDVYGFDESDDTWHATANDITTTPVGPSVTYQGLDSAAAVYVPQGAAGYTWLKEATPATGTLTVGTETGSSTVPKAVSFAVWDNRLWAISTDGVLFFTFTGQDETSWQTIPDHLNNDDPLKLDPAATPTALIPFYDRSGNPTLHVVTNRGVFWLNQTAKSWESTNTAFPVHPSSGLAAAVWRTGEDLWVSNGVGIVRTSPAGAIVPKAGLDRDNGLPVEFRGAIRSLCPEWSALYALVRGNSSFEETPEMVEDGIFDDESYLPVGTARSLLCKYQGTGWHPIWESAAAVESVSWATLSNVTDGYRLWWGAGPYVYTQRLRKDFYNPREGLQAGLDDFQATDTLYSMRFDANMEGFDKLASRLVLDCEAATADEKVTAYYQTNADNIGTWHELGSATAPGQTSLGFAPRLLEDGTTFHDGVRFNWIAFKLVWERGGNTKRTPLLTAANLHFTKIPQNVTSLVVTIPLPNKTEFGRDGKTMARELRDLLTNSTFVEVEHQDDLYRCQVAGVLGVDTPGVETAGTREVHLLEIAV